MAPSRNPDAGALKAKRVAAVQAGTASADPPPPNADVAVAVGEPDARRYSLLFDPREPVFAPAEGSGIAPPGVGSGYVVAECDVSEQITPPGCVTPLSRNRWRKGHHVPRHIHDQWKAEQDAAGKAADAEPATEENGEATA